MKLVYISGPYSADSHNKIWENINAARAVAAKYWKLGYAVICPHQNTLFMDGIVPNSHDVFLNGDLKMIESCDAVIMLPGWKESAGASKERDFALKLNKRIVYEN
jgi:hypothetical protein